MQTHFNITEAKANLSKIIAHIEAGGDPITLTRAGKPLADIIPTQKKIIPPVIGWYEKEFGPIELPDDWDEWPDDIARALYMTDEHPED